MKKRTREQTEAPQRNPRRDDPGAADLQSLISKSEDAYYEAPLLVEIKVESMNIRHSYWKECQDQHSRVSQCLKDEGFVSSCARRIIRVVEGGIRYSHVLKSHLAHFRCTGGIALCTESVVVLIGVLMLNHHG
jgi:hypothetical protein